MQDQKVFQHIVRNILGKDYVNIESSFDKIIIAPPCRINVLSTLIPEILIFTTNIKYILSFR